MTNDHKIKDEKLQNYINREAAKISAILSGKIDKYEYLTGEEILSSNQRQIIEQVKFTYSPKGKAFENQTERLVIGLKSLNSSNKKNDLKQIEGIFPQNLMNGLIDDSLKEIVNLKAIIKTVKLHYKSKRRKF